MFSDYVKMAQDGGKFVSLKHDRFYPQKILLVLISPEALSLQCHSAIGRITSTKNSTDTIRNQTSDLPICSTAP